MFEYTLRRPTRRTAGRSDNHLSTRGRRTRDAVVVTMVEPSVRAAIDRATDTAFAKVHVSTVAEALTAVRGHSMGALLLSPAIARQHPLAELARLVVTSPGVTAVAVVGEDSSASHDALLALGACGVREVVNLSRREGWNQLRELVDQTTCEGSAQILDIVLSSLEDASDESRHFFGTLIRTAPRSGSVKSLAVMLGVQPSTLMSRFFRASLPAPKTYVSMTRLLYAASLFEAKQVSIASVAYRLSFSSPQSFGRHVRTTLGLSAGEFRRDFPFRDVLDHYVGKLIVPFKPTFRTFSPQGSMSTVRSREVNEQRSIRVVDRE